MIDLKKSKFIILKKKKNLLYFVSRHDYKNGKNCFEMIKKRRIKQKT